MSHDEARKEYERAMGSELGEVYHLLWNQCALLHIHWEEYLDLFGKNQEQFDVMNGVAPALFKSVQDAWWGDILLHLCRFADPPVVGHRKTLSLEALLNCSESKAVANLAVLVMEARKKIKFAQDWRHRTLAHLDLEYAKDRGAKPLATASRLHVKEALAAIASALESVDKHFTGSQLMFEGAASSGGSHLIRELRLIARIRKERKERLLSGTATDDDQDWQKWH